jgi:hypothetical protein
MAPRVSVADPSGSLAWVSRRYVGCCNVHTDIKEACFFGKYVVAAR